MPTCTANASPPVGLARAGSPPEVGPRSPSSFSPFPQPGGDAEETGDSSSCRLSPESEEAHLKPQNQQMVISSGLTCVFTTSPEITRSGRTRHVQETNLL